MKPTTTHTTPHKIEPWYQQFWPWFLIMLPACVVCAGITTVIIASRGADDLVADDYYKNGLSINRQIEKQQRAEHEGISASLVYSSGVVTATFTGTEIKAAQLDLLLSHPLEADRDVKLTLLRTAANTFQVNATVSGNTSWHWILQNRHEPIWRLDGSLQIDSR